MDEESLIDGFTKDVVVRDLNEALVRAKIENQRLQEEINRLTQRLFDTERTMSDLTSMANTVEELYDQNVEEKDVAVAKDNCEPEPQEVRLSISMWPPKGYEIKGWTIIPVREPNV